MNKFLLCFLKHSQSMCYPQKYIRNEHMAGET